MNKKQDVGLGVALAIIVLYIGVKMYAAGVAEAKVDAAIADAAGFADINYENVSVDLLAYDVSISGIVVSPVNAGKKIRIDEIVLHDIDSESEIPKYLSVSVNGIELNIDDMGKDAKGLKALGYDGKMMINFMADYTYDKEKKELDIKKIAMGADDAGNISISLRLGNINLEPEEMTALLFTFPQVVFHGAEIKYEDDSLFDRIIKAEAKKKRKDLKKFKKSLIKDFEKVIEKEKDDFTKKALNEIKGFFEDPEEFSLSAAPAKPQPLGSIMRVKNPKDVIKLLDLQIES